MKGRAIGPDRRRGGDHFFGIHFDLHAGQQSTRIGERVTPALIERLIRKIKPDFIQVDSKGHAGISSFKTKVGAPAPGFVREHLHVWRRVTARHHVALYGHHSGVWDYKAVEKHPAWARINADGKRDRQATSMWSPYVDAWLIPQLKELCDVYGLDGVWIDGDNWGVDREYGRAAAAAFQRRTGLKVLPRKPGDPGYVELNDMMRDAYRVYLQHYVEAMAAHNPEFRVTSNWAYTAAMPEPVSVGVARLSGDSVPPNGVNMARFEARYMAQQGTPWDLMCWGFSLNKPMGPMHMTKPAVQLMQEAAVVLALGGGFQAYYRHREDCSIYEWQMDLYAEVAKFCRARQAVCHRAEPVPQIALLHPTSSVYRENSNVLHGWHYTLQHMMGVCQVLLDGQQVVDVVSEHHVTDRLDAYGLVVLPEWATLAPAFRKELVAYVKRGGALLCIGPGALRQFAAELDLEPEGDPQVANRYIVGGGLINGIQARIQKVKPRRRARITSRFHAEESPDAARGAAATVAKLGKGRIGAICFDVGKLYVHSRDVALRDFVKERVRELFPRPLVEVSGSRLVDIVPTRKAGCLNINLINVAGTHADAQCCTYDEVPCVGPLTIKIRLPERPRRIRQEPEGRALRFTYRAGMVEVVLPQLVLHTVLVVE